jgi:hypothetical protein
MNLQTAKFLVTGFSEIDVFVDTLSGDDGLIRVGDDLVIELLPARDDWETVIQQVIGIILLVDGRDAEAFPDVQPTIDSLRAEKAVPLIIGVTGQEHPDAGKPNDLRAHLPEDNPHKVFPCIVGDKTSAENVLLALIYQILS